jgi:endoglucanase
VSGGWADASDYLQYVTTSAAATFDMLAAYRDHPRAFADAFDARGLPGANGIPDVLDEARHGLEWLAAMFPNDTEMYNQLADDRDHTYFDMIVNDSADYGWGKGKERPVYPCTGRPQGLFGHKNRSTGYASTAGKYAAAFGLGALTFARSDSAFAATLRHKAFAAYALGRAHPGACQTAPGTSPYFYEEDSWRDDMELGATQIYQLTRDEKVLEEALADAAAEAVTPWMGADTARHYQWFPWFNFGHYELTRAEGGDAVPRAMSEYYREGLKRVASRAHNGFRVGIPFIWCSNDLMTAFATQALLYRQMSGDVAFREYEQAALDWLFGVNPWGVSMVIGYPHSGVTAQDPHSVHSHNLGVQVMLGGLLDGPVYRSIYGHLRGIQLINPDEYAPFNTGFIVYHDDLGDYSTNEPIMDGTASLVYLLSALAR